MYRSEARETYTKSSQLSEPARTLARTILSREGGSRKLQLGIGQMTRTRPAGFTRGAGNALSRDMPQGSGFCIFRHLSHAKRPDFAISGFIVLLSPGKVNAALDVMLNI